MLFQGQYLNVDEALKDIQNCHPVITVFGEDLTKLRDPKVVIEKVNVFNMPSVLAAVEYCLSSYYVYNIKYHTDSKPLCFFLEFLYGINVSSMKLPICVQTSIDGILRQD